MVGSPESVLGKVSIPCITTSKSAYRIDSSIANSGAVIAEYIIRIIIPAMRDCFFDISKVRILLIEDDLSILSFIKKGLKEMNHTVDSFSNGNDGLDAGYLNEHDIIILDRMLPGIDGLTIVTKLRNNKI